MKARKGQSVFDIATQNFGQIDDVVTLANDNGLSLNEEVPVTQELEINNPVGTGNDKVKESIAVQGLSFNNELIEGFSKEYQKVYDSFIKKPSDIIARRQDLIVRTLVNAKLWPRIDIFYCFAHESNPNGEALKNWPSPGTFDAVMVNSPIFTSLEGIKGNAVNAFLRSNWNPNLDAINYALNSGSFGYYNRVDYVAGNKVEMGEIGLGGLDGLTGIAKFGGNLAIIRVNSTTLASVVNTDAKGFYIANRVLNTEQDFYRNKIRIINSSDLSTGINSRELYMLALNNNGLPGFYSDAQLSFAFAASGLSQSEINIIVNAIETYMDSNGKGIIS